MDKDLLESVIEAEKEIQACIELERKQAKEWLESQKKLTIADAEKARGEIQDALNAAVSEAAEEAERRAREMVGETAATAQALDSIGEDALRGIIRGQMHRILVG